MRSHTANPAPSTLRGSALAIDGGSPIRTRPLPAWPHFADDEIAAATEVLRSGKINYWTGCQGRHFEEEFAAFHGRKYAVAVANGTVALELALRALGLSRGEEVIVPSRTFIASASSVVLAGATPVFADVDLTSQTLTAETVRRVISRRTKAIIAVHLAGWMCDMDSLLALAREHHIKVIEDCAQAHGARCAGQLAGATGDLAAFSFCQDKIMSTGGEGGMLVTDDEKLWRAAWSFKDHGKNYGRMREQHSSAAFRWVHDSIGTNWRLTEMQAAIGRVLLHKLERQVEIRRSHAEVLTRRLAQVPGLRITRPPSGIQHAFYKYYAFVRPELLQPGWTRDRIVAAICAEGTPCAAGSCSEVYLERAFPARLRPAERLHNARELGETSLMFLVHPTLADEDLADIGSAAAKVLDVAASPARNQIAA